MLNEEVARYRELSGDTNPNTPISRIGGYLDGYEKALEQKPETGYCKDCKYFEYDIVEKINGIPVIVAHEICKRWGAGWGSGCKTKADGYCFLYEPQESEGKA